MSNTDTNTAANADTAVAFEQAEQTTITDRGFVTSTATAWHGASTPPEPSRPSRSRWPLMIAAAVAAVLSAGAAGYLVGEPNDDAPPVATHSPAVTNSAVTSIEPPTTAEAETTPLEPELEREPATTNPRPSGVLGEPAGAFCRDLAAKGYSYADAVTYWEHHGRPSHMDATGTSIPCRTVYPAGAVEAHWGRDALAKACPNETVLLSAYLDAHPENASYTAGLRDIRCIGSWASGTIRPSVPSDPGSAIFRLDNGAPRLLTYGSGMHPEWCEEELAMPTEVAYHLCV